MIVWLTAEKYSKKLKYVYFEKKIKYVYFEICLFIIFIMDKVLRKSLKYLVLSLNRFLLLRIYIASININRILRKLEKMIFQYLFSLFLLVCEYINIQKGEQIFYSSIYMF